MSWLKLLLKKSEIRNTGWLVGGKLSQMLLSFIVGLWSARYLGPSNYGLLNYISAYASFFSSLCTLGITSSVLISEFTKRPDEEGITLGTSMAMCQISSLLSALMIVAVVFLADDGEPVLTWIAIFSGLGLVFKTFDILEYWFLNRYLSKITAIASLIGYCITSLYKVSLLITKRNVVFFSIANSIDYIVIAVILFLAYKRENGPRLHFSWKRGKEILSVSYHFILSGLMVAIYGQTDKIMLKFLLSETDVGYYSTAASLSTMWCFLLSAIISSLSPAIVCFKNEGKEAAYLRKNRQLYAIVFHISMSVSILLTMFAPMLIRILYGEAYSGSVAPLRVVTWYVAFSYLGVARDIWLVCENKQRYSKYMYVIAALVNVGMNYICIPMWGATGAAVASLVTQIITSVLAPLIWKEMRMNVKLIIEGVLCLDFWKKRRKRGEIIDI